MKLMTLIERFQMKKLAVLGTAIALSNMTYAADAATQAQIDELKTQNDIGVNYWLADTAVLKADYFRQETAGELSATGYNLGVGFSF